MIVLIGFMAAGKTTTGRILADAVGLPFVDTDAVVEERAGAPVAQIFELGEAAFRAIEREVVAEVLAGPDAVVALGGGAIEDPATAAALAGRDVVWLDVSFQEALRRAGASGSRPLLEGSGAESLWTSRRTLYESAASLTVSTLGRSPEEVAAEIAGAIGRPPGGDARGAGDAPERKSHVRRVAVSLGPRSYEVVVGEGIVSELPHLVPMPEDAEKAFVITHPSLAPAARATVSSLEAAGLATSVVDVPEGERAKNLASAAALYDSLGAAGAHRHDLVIGWGGGVITDLAGFVASTYLRGMPVVHVPTTLLGQVDAAIGGKTGVNLSHGKNLVGTIYQPLGVVCDVAFLETLGEEEMRSGMAEVIKYGFIADPTLLDLIESKPSAIGQRDRAFFLEIVERSAAIKAAVVAGDERESGRRAILNYGHTFGHAIEHATGFSGYRHGEAVALGMMCAAQLAGVLGMIDQTLVERHRRLLELVGLPVTGAPSMKDLEAAWSHDKKYRRGVRFVLLEDAGKPVTGVDAPRSAIETALEKVGGIR